MQTDNRVWCKNSDSFLHVEEAKYILCEKHFKVEFLKNLKVFCDAYDEDAGEYPESKLQGEDVYTWIKEKLSIEERFILRSKEESKPKSPKYYGEQDTK
jgi:hypothetical protein